MSILVDGAGHPPEGVPPCLFRGTTPATGRNLVLTFDDSDIDGIIASSITHHAVDTITADDDKQLGVVTNTAGTAINNGVIVSLTGDSTWTVPGTSCLSSLTIGDAASVVGAAGQTVSMTVDGVATPIAAGQTYTGDVVLSVS